MIKGDMMKFLSILICGAISVGVMFGFFANTSRAESIRANTPLQIGYPADETICVNGKTYTGCCSGNDGVAKITDDVLICANGNQSKTCKGEPEVNLAGCCSGNEGVDYANPDRTIVCKNGDRKSVV